MDWHAAVLRHMVLPARWRAQGLSTGPWLKRLHNVERLPRRVLEERQWRALRSMVSYAERESPFYGEQFAAAGVRASDLQRPEDFLAFPITTREALQTNLSDVVTPRPSRLMREAATGGTTGYPLRFFRDLNSLSAHRAIDIYLDTWVGWRPGQWRALIWGAAPDIAGHERLRARLRRALLDRTSILSALDMTPDRMTRFAAELKRRRPRMTLAYPSAMAIFARFVLDSNLAPVPTGPIVVTAETLLPEHRELAQAAFGATVFDRYGCRECGMVASECDYHDGLHILTESVYLEIVRNGQACSTGEHGRVLLTDLQNRAMPFIRYHVGDLAALSDRQCPCGRESPMLAWVGGREADWFVSASGALVSGTVLSSSLGELAKRGVTGQVQLVQEAPGQLRVKVAGPPLPSHVLGELRAYLTRYLGHSAIIFESVPAILPEASGKHRVAVRRFEVPAALAGPVDLSES